MPGLWKNDAVLIPDEAEASAVYNKGFFGEPQPGGALLLDLLEATHLVEAGRLAVEDGGMPVDLADLTRRAHALDPAFEVRYLVYRDLRLRGYVVKAQGDPVDFRVYPRGGGPKKTPSKHWVWAVSERSAFDLPQLAAVLERATEARKQLLLGVVDEESDLTYYLLRTVSPKGRIATPALSSPATAYFLGDRSVAFLPTDGWRLHKEAYFGHALGRRVHLSLMETAYLARRGLLDVRDGKTNRKMVSDAVLRRATRVQPDMPLRLAVYEDLRARGVVPKTGFKYGSHFRAYEGDPEGQHARYLVHALPWEFRGLWPEISRAVRLAHGVRKEILIARVGERVEYLRLTRVRP